MLKSGMMLGDRYEIIELIGSGGMSEVYKAKDHKLNRYVAVKVLKNEFSDDRNFVSKFRVEAQSAAGLAHSNIVNVYDVGEDEGIYYIVMEYVEGITLKEYILDHGRLPADQALDFALQIASGIEVAHQNHTIHRDIKPQNIIVSKSGTLKVTDFGIARAATSNTVASNAMGSVHYISPEQARGGYSDEKSDIYSLGITMYEMVTGRLPFEGDNNVTVALMHIQGEMIPPREYYPDIPASLEKVILKCTQKKAERRYLTASALIADLKRVATNPNGDFVVIGNQNSVSAPTVMMSQEELDSIKESASQIPVHETDSYSGGYQSGYDSNYQDPDDYEEEPVRQAPVRQQTYQNTETQRTTARPSAEQQRPVSRPSAEQRRENLRSAYQKSEDDFDPDDEDYGFNDNEDENEHHLTDYINTPDDEDEIDPKLHKIIVICGILAAVLIAMVVMLLVGRAAGWFKFGGSDKTTASSVEDQAVEMSVDVVGKTLEQAEQALKSADIPYETQTENSDEIDSGIVISQSYKKGEMIPAGSKVKIIISGGKEEVAVPNVVGYEADQADTILKNDNGFVITHSYEYSDDVEKDHVISTEPAASQMVAKGSTVKIVVSNGPEVKEQEVPDLRGKTQQEAQATLQNIKMNLGNITEEYSDTVETGKIISQSTAPGTKVNEGSAVDVTISKGAQPTEAKATTYKASFSGEIKYTGPAEGAGYTVEVRYVIGDTAKTVVNATRINPANPTLTIPTDKVLTGLSQTGNLQVLYDGSATKPEDVQQSVNVSLSEE